MIDDALLSTEFGSIMNEYEKVCADNEKTPPSRNVADRIKKEWGGSIAERGD